MSCEYTYKGNKYSSIEGVKKVIDYSKVSEAYHKAKADDSNPELVNAVEKLLGGEPKAGKGVVTENDKAIADALATPENTAKALESASTFQPKRIEELTAPKIGYSATLFDKDGKVVENKIEVLDIDTETNIATIVGAKGREKKVPVARIRKTIEQVSKEFHSGDIEPELLTDIVTKDISDPVVNQQRRMSAEVSGVGQKNLISRTPTWIQNIYKKFISAGDRNTLRALEAKDSIMAEKQDRLAEVSKRISDSLRKDPSLRKAANTVLSQDYIDDKIDSFTNKKTDEAIAVLTGTDIEQLREAYEKPDLESSRLLLAQVNDNLKSQTTNGSKKEVDDLVYAEVTKDREKVRDLATRWVNVGRENNTASARKQARDDIENQLSQLANGEEIIDTLKASRKETISAKRELLKTKPGRELLSTMNESRDMIDEFAKWVEGNLAALNIKDRDIGQSIINNSGLYMKKTYDYWTDKDFTLDEKLGKQAVDSIKRAMLPQRLSALASTKKFESASENKRAEMIQKLEEKAEQDASKIFTNYVADITAKKDYKPSTVKVNAAKVQSKNTWEREFINKEFGRILGKSEDAIDRLHASVMAQAQIQSAAEMGMILEQLSGGDFYNSRESAIDALLKTGMSEVEAGVYIGKNYKEVSDRFSPLNGKLIPTEMYDMVYEDLNMSHSALFNWLKAATVLWRMSKTVFNPSGHITNALGGNIAIAEQGHLIDSQTVNFFMDRFRLMSGSGKISDEAKAIKSKMIDTGLWGSSVSLGEINLLLKYSNDLNSGDKNRSEKALIALKKGFNEKFGGVKRYYSATDDFSKLILFHKKKDVFAKKLYGKPYESLNSKEEAIVDANIAERVKQNMPTASRIPKFAKAIIGSVVIGDFQGFRFGAFTSFANTLGNAVGDINKGLNDKSLSKEQKKAYLLDGAKTLSASAAIFSVDKSIGATVAGLSSIALGNMAKGLFDEEKDEDGTPIGTRFDFYQNIKNSFYLPSWGKGQNVIITSDDGKGNLQLMNLSNTFPNDEAYQLLGAQKNLPLISMDGDSGISSVLKKTFSLNAVLNIFNNVIRGYDNWNRPIEDGVLAKSLYVAGEFTIPSIRHLHKEAVTYAKDQVGQAPEDYNEIDARKVEVFNYLKGMLTSSPQLIKRTFPLKMNQQVYYNLKALYNGKETKFERLSEKEKYQRIKELEPVRKAFVEMKKYNIHQKNSVPADEVFDRAFTGLRGKVSEEEQNYILTGEKPFNE
jgi:hypothetical protein